MKTFKEFLDYDPEVKNLLKALNEMAPPMHLPGTLETESRLMTVSDESLTNRFILLDSAYDKDESIRFYIRKTLGEAIVVVKNSGNLPNKIICSLHFKDKSPIEKTLQVDLVTTDKNYRSFGVATVLYLTLAKSGYNIVSDYQQYNDAIKLWKSITDNKGNLKVKVFDAKTKEYLKDDSGKDLEYSPKDIPDHDIWSTKPDRSKIMVLLVLSK